MTDDQRFMAEIRLHELLKSAQAGDREAFAQVIEQVQPFIYKMARQYARQFGGAPVEDLVQTGLLAAVRSVPCFDPSVGVKFISYAGIAAQRAIHRASNCWKPYPQASHDETDYIAELPDGRTPETQKHDADEAVAIRKLIADHLGDRDSNLVQQRFGLDGGDPRTYSELAQNTGTSRQNVQQLVERALRRLRNALDTTPA